MSSLVALPPCSQLYVPVMHSLLISNVMTEGQVIIESVISQSVQFQVSTFQRTVGASMGTLGSRSLGMVLCYPQVLSPGEELEIPIVFLPRRKGVISGQVKPFPHAS